MRVTALFADLFALFYPELCFACDEVLVSGERDCCTTCRMALPYQSYHLPTAATASTDTPLHRRFWGKVKVEHAIAYLQFSPRSRVQQLLHRLKYDNQPEIGQILGRWFGEELRQAGYADTFTSIVPVPMHPAKQQRRGYNQAEQFANGLSESVGLPVLPRALVKVTDAESQTRKGRFERWQNTSGGFELGAGMADELVGQHVLLVDDVLTTGATLEACALALLTAKETKVSIATIAAAGH